MIIAVIESRRNGKRLAIISDAFGESFLGTSLPYPIQGSVEWKKKPLNEMLLLQTWGVHAVGSGMYEWSFVVKIFSLKVVAAGAGFHL